ncbi:hypothetical protein BKA66DRAFT_575529 [Pyrenochaeta sp. MPI-SDFR-AT-0127]|nr:hypothetical protein BKA66DRAFT_575529 [Pyrenochaeta sp. MPI-SDFR-AT-0127]
MSDSTSTNSSPGSFARRRRRRIPTGFSMAINPADGVEHSPEPQSPHATLLHRIERLGAALDTAWSEWPSQTDVPQAGFRGLVQEQEADDRFLEEAMADSQINTNNWGQQESGEPVTTLVSALPKTTYKDQDDTKGFEKTLPYISVQRALLKYLDSHASDTLTPLQARLWTQAIDPVTQRPMADEALRLCYYMRSQGFDTYAVIKNGLMSLFVVHEFSRERNEKHDHIYWQQHVKTNYILYIASTEHGTTVQTRRNAMVAENMLLPVSQLRGMRRQRNLLAQLRGGEAAPLATLEGSNDDRRGVARMGTRIMAGDEPGDTQHRQTDPAIETLMIVAQAELDRLLNGDNQDPSAIEAALEQIEELQQQIYRD